MMCPECTTTVKPYPVLVALAGKSGSGKNTLAELLKLHLESEGKTVRLMAFADPIKDICKDIFGYDEYSLTTQKGKTVKLPHNSRTAREMMQTIGTDVFVNHFDKDVWIDLLHKRIAECDNDYDVIIVTDVRNIRELESFNRYPNNIKIWISRDTPRNDGTKPVNRFMKLFSDKHITENFNLKDECGIVIKNNKSLLELFKTAGHIVHLNLL